MSIEDVKSDWVHFNIGTVAGTAPAVFTRTNGANINLANVIYTTPVYQTSANLVVIAHTLHLVGGTSIISLESVVDAVGMEK